MKKYRFIKPETEERNNTYIYLSNLIYEKLNDDEVKILEKEFKEYRDLRHQNGFSIKPWYMWICERVEISI